MGCEITHKNCEGHHHHHCATEHGDQHAHTPTQVKVSAISPQALEPKKTTESPQKKKQNSTFSLLKGAALLSVAGAASFVFFHIYKQGSLSFTSYQVPFDTTSLNPVTSGSLTCKPHHIATALFVESLFFLKQSYGSATLQDFVSLAKNSPAIATRYIHNWKDGAIDLAHSLVCAKNNGISGEEQDKVSLYAAHKIAPDYEKETLIEHALGCRDIDPLKKGTFKNNALAFLNILDQYQEVEQSLQKHDPLTARVLANKIAQEPESYRRSPNLQEVAHGNIDKKYLILAQRSDGLSLFEKALTTFLSKNENSSEMSLMLLQELIKFREAAFTYANINNHVVNPTYWEERLKQIINTSSFTQKQTAQWFSLISSKGEQYTPWLRTLLKMIPFEDALLPQLQPSQEIPLSLQLEHKILALDTYVLQLNTKTHKDGFNLLLSQIDEFLNKPELSNDNRDRLHNVIRNFLKVYISSEENQFLSGSQVIYTPPKDVSESCLELVVKIFLEKNLDLTNVLLPFSGKNLWESWKMPLERRINIELYNGSILPTKATELIQKVIQYKASENWALRFPYLQQIIEKASNPSAEQLVDWCLLMLSHNDTGQVNDLLEMVLKKISTISSDKATQLIRKILEKNLKVSHVQTIMEAAAPHTQQHLVDWIRALLSNPSQIKEEKTVVYELLDKKLLPQLSGIRPNQANELRTLIFKYPTSTEKETFSLLEKVFKEMSNPQWDDLKSWASALLEHSADSSRDKLLSSIIEARWNQLRMNPFSKLQTILLWFPDNEKFANLVMNYLLEKTDLELTRFTLAMQLIDRYPGLDLAKIVNSYKAQSGTFNTANFESMKSLSRQCRENLKQAFAKYGLHDVANKIDAYASTSNEGKIS